MAGNDDILAVIPPGPDDFDFDQIDCLPVGPDVTIVDDFELLVDSGCPVLDIAGKESKMIFYTESTLPLICFHIKSVEKYLGLTLKMTDDSGEARTVNFNTKSSIVTLDKNTLNLPINIGDGWQFLCLDFRKLCNHGFGTNYSHCTEVQVQGSCRLSKIFFESREFSDIELPAYLRVCQVSA